jgi:prevent-host-death family protein
MSRQVNVHEAKTQFSKIIAAVEAGEEIVVARAGKPIIKLVKIDEQLPPPIVPGFAHDLLPDVSDEEWDALNVEFNSLFRDKNFDR